VTRQTILDPTPRLQLVARGLRLESLTVGWNILEGLVAIGAALAAGSIALLGFGVDSVVETVSGIILIWRLRAEARGTADKEEIERVERRAERLVGVAFLLLAAYVTIEAVSALAQGERPDASLVGVLITGLSIPVMLWLAAAKRRAGRELGSRALIADAMQTQACWYLSVVTLAGLALNAVAGAWWADPVAGLGVALLLVREGVEAVRGEEDDDEVDELADAADGVTAVGETAVGETAVGETAVGDAARSL
jgi:divalent metal cation (Fe/Co/Zn/Cd) transporter